MAKRTEVVDHIDTGVLAAVEALELEAAVTADHNPAETARERLARLEKETAAQLADAKRAVEDEEKTRRSAFVTVHLLPAVQKVIHDTEAATGLVMRNLVVRYNRPGDAVPMLWNATDSNGRRIPLPVDKAGITVSYRLVRARKKD